MDVHIFWMGCFFCTYPITLMFMNYWKFFFHWFGKLPILLLFPNQLPMLIISKKLKHDCSIKTFEQ